LIPPALNSAQEMLDLVIGSDSTGRQLFLRDVADLQRDYADPPRRILRFDGKPAIGLGISTVEGGNVVTMGQGASGASWTSSGRTSPSASRSARSTSSSKPCPKRPATLCST
jgi:hypothetical protein